MKYSLKKRIAICFMILMILALAPARAEDFSGFYAGINAGYAWGKDRDRVGTVPNPGSRAGNDRPGAGPDLPHSANSAAAALRRAGRSGTGPNVGR